MYINDKFVNVNYSDIDLRKPSQNYKGFNVVKDRKNFRIYKQTSDGLSFLKFIQFNNTNGYTKHDIIEYIEICLSNNKTEREN
jgi:hypothetical protein